MNQKHKGSGGKDCLMQSDIICGDNTKNEQEKNHLRKVIKNGFPLWKI